MSSDKDQIPSPKNINEIKTMIKNQFLSVNDESYSRKLLIEGMENIKNRITYNEKLKEAGNIHLNTEDISGGWICNFVRDILGGKINGKEQTIYWIIGDKEIKFNPFSGDVYYDN